MAMLDHKHAATTRLCVKGTVRLPLAGEGPQQLGHQVQEQRAQLHQRRVVHVAHQPGRSADQKRVGTRSRGGLSRGQQSLRDEHLDRTLATRDTAKPNFNGFLMMMIPETLWTTTRSCLHDV